MDKRCTGYKILISHQSASTATSRRNRVEDRRLREEKKKLSAKKKVGFKQLKPTVTAQQSRDAWVVDLTELQAQKQYLGGGFNARILQAKRTAIAAYEVERVEWENDGDVDDVAIRPWSAALEKPDIQTQNLSYTHNRPTSGTYFRCSTNPSIRHHRDQGRISGAAGPSKFGESSLGLPYSSVRQNQARRPKSSSSLAPASGQYRAVTISAEGIECNRIKSKGGNTVMTKTRPATAGANAGSSNRTINPRPGSSPPSYWRQRDDRKGSRDGGRVLTHDAGGSFENPPRGYPLLQDSEIEGPTTTPSVPTVYMGRPYRSEQEQQQSQQWQQEQGGKWPDRRMKSGTALTHLRTHAHIARLHEKSPWRSPCVRTLSLSLSLSLSDSNETTQTKQHKRNNTNEITQTKQHKRNNTNETTQTKQHKRTVYGPNLTGAATVQIA
jgi:hypothetical protein